MAHHELDLLVMARLSIHRNDLAMRNANVPAALPAVWAALEQPVRVKSLARSIPCQYRQADVLTQVAQAVAAVGDLDRAETISRSIPNPDQQARALTRIAEIAGMLGVAGDQFMALWSLPLPRFARVWSDRQTFGLSRPAELLNDLLCLAEQDGQGVGWRAGFRLDPIQALTYQRLDELVLVLQPPALHLGGEFQRPFTGNPSGDHHRGRGGHHLPPLVLAVGGRCCGGTGVEALLVELVAIQGHIVRVYLQ